MRDLDDALARLARRDELQKRASNGHHEGRRPAVDEVADALRQVAERHPGLSAVVRLDEGGTSTEIRVASEAGKIRVTTMQISPPLTATTLNASPSLLGEFSVTDAPLPSGPLTADPPTEHPITAEPFAPTAAADLPHRRPEPPPAGPPEWPLRAEAAPRSPEARLAELLRRDRSLLERPLEGRHQEPS